MPKVSSEYRQARKDEIAGAALRSLRKHGVSGTSIAQIVEESGQSAGAIYNHFSNKAELAQYIASTLLSDHIGKFERSEARDGTLTPLEAMKRLLAVAQGPDIPYDVILQFWGETSNDEGLRDAILRTVARMRQIFALSIRDWAQRRAGGGDAAALADRTAAVMVMVSQGYIAHSAIAGPQDVDRYLDDVAFALAD
jgi:AcrR family transcriptional regulator